MKRQTQGEDSHLRVGERDLEKVPASQPPAGTHPAMTVISDFQPPEARQRISVKSPSSRYLWRPIQSSYTNTVSM